MFDKIFEFVLYFIAIIIGIILTPMHIAICVLNDISNMLEAAWMGLLFKILLVSNSIEEKEYNQVIMDELVDLNLARYLKRMKIFNKITGL